MKSASFALVLNEFETKTRYKENYILYMMSMEFLEMINYVKKNQVKFFYCYEL